MKRILITGSSGFVAQNLLNSLKEQKNNIIPFSRFKDFDYNIIDYIWWTSRRSAAHWCIIVHNIADQAGWASRFGAVYCFIIVQSVID